MAFAKLKTAIVCDWLTDFGGAERVILELHRLFPEAPIYTSIYKPANFPQLKKAKVITSFIQKIPYLRGKHRLCLPLMPLAFEQFDLSDYDLVVSSSHSCSKGVITKPSTLHVCYCHTPMRYVWDDYHQYLAGYRLPKIFLNRIYHKLSKIRIWDRLAADRVDFFVANSDCVKQRIQKYYRRESAVIYPPVDVERFSLATHSGDYFLAVGRLIPYKRFDLLIEAANCFKFPLKIVGEGRELAYLKTLAGPTVEFSGRLSEKALFETLHGCKALLFPQVEDFGIIVLEAMACGKPVIAYNKGGALEIVVEGRTGLFFNEQTVESIGEAIKKFENVEFVPMVIRKQAEKFGGEVFTNKLMEFIERKWGEFVKK